MNVLYYSIFLFLNLLVNKESSFSMCVDQLVASALEVLNALFSISKDKDAQHKNKVESIIRIIYIRMYLFVYI